MQKIRFPHTNSTNRSQILEEELKKYSWFRFYTIITALEFVWGLQCYNKPFSLFEHNGSMDWVSSKKKKIRWNDFRKHTELLISHFMNILAICERTNANPSLPGTPWPSAWPSSAPAGSRTRGANATIRTLPPTWTRCCGRTASRRSRARRCASSASRPTSTSTWSTCSRRTVAFRRIWRIPSVRTWWVPGFVFKRGLFFNRGLKHDSG